MAGRTEKMELRTSFQWKFHRPDRPIDWDEELNTITLDEDLCVSSREGESASFSILQLIQEVYYVSWLSKDEGEGEEADKHRAIDSAYDYFRIYYESNTSLKIK